MKANLTKALSLLLVLVLALGLFAGCGDKQETPAPETTPETEREPVEEAVYVDPYPDGEEDYDGRSTAIYDLVLGEFYDLYEQAKAAGTVPERHARMALAEAKMLESAVMVPLTTKGGQYAIDRVAPNTCSTVLWGNDASRWHTCWVTEELITNEDRVAMKSLWAENKGSGTWMDLCRAYLEEHGYTLKQTMNLPYNGDPKVWDVLATSQSGDSEVLVYTYDSLVAYDTENVLQPALAESWEVSEDGLTYTFHLRDGINWVDSQGRDIAPVRADDFAAGMRHMMDAAGGLEYLVQGVIAGATAYINGEITDFEQVGVKALDDRTVQYTLEAPTSYFMTMLTYGVFAPLCREYYEAQGGLFGADFDNSAAEYTYGKTKDNIAYCGPYLITNATPENTIVFKANPTYWDPDSIHVQTLTWLYNDGKDATKAYNDTMADALDRVVLNASALEAAKTDDVADTYAFVSRTEGTTYSAYYNVNRAAFSNYNDDEAKSLKTPEQAERDCAALLNVHFRRAITFAMDRAAYNAQTTGEELKLTSLRNSYTPGTFVSLAEDVTIELNGEDVTFPAGTFYGEIVQAQLDADQIPIRVWNPEADGGVGSSDGYDGWYNPEAAKAEMAIAVEELAAIGIEISAENPIHLEMPYFAGAETEANRCNAYKQFLETNLEGRVIMDLIPCSIPDQVWYAGYYITYGSEANYDIYDVSGWGPDYGDPQSYLDTLLPDYAGYVTKYMGMF